MIRRDCLTTPIPFQTDVIMTKQQEYYKYIRDNIREFISSIPYNPKETYLEIGPSPTQDSLKKLHANIETLDIDPMLGCTYTYDLTKPVDLPCKFHAIVCMEVLEHTTNPFIVVENLHKALLPGGMFYLSVPFQFRLHGPFPDCFRISEFGLKALLKDFEIIKLDCIYDKETPYFPIHYTCVARKPIELTTQLHSG